MSNLSDNELMTKSRNELLTICVRQRGMIQEMNTGIEQTHKLMVLIFEKTEETSAQIHSMISEARQHSPLKVTWRKDKDT